MNRQRGLTLIEILIALIVMTVGFTGILALFPAGLEANKRSVEDTTGAYTAESVANALDAAFAAWTTGPGGARHLLVNHDGTSSVTGARVYYEFDLPAIADGWRHHPATTFAGTPTGADPEAESYWSLTGDPWTRAQFDEVRAMDGSEALDQFAYAFDVRKVNTMEYLPLAQAETLCRAYDVRIHVFRRQADTGAKRWVASVSRRYAVK